MKKRATMEPSRRIFFYCTTIAVQRRESFEQGIAKGLSQGLQQGLS